MWLGCQTSRLTVCDRFVVVLSPNGLTLHCSIGGYASVGRPCGDPNTLAALVFYEILAGDWTKTLAWAVDSWLLDGALSTVFANSALSGTIVPAVGSSTLI
ncbi:uncharacterized protein APUU_11404S [Aspergillus puulaauensis]|uniref:Uncharacterized protein n=1 Tax=Aspergillus puulaauensis TaxID=1220207 RepID=A0A7R7XC85_9EURO|nr:uncharacterized protein APUU_11404S [Aspergillus puulaauensis]BCS18576.1 hypothetical protein APUU_11404S [Aspergillus puulaauensis]